MKKQRKHYTPEEKVAILRRHLLEKVLISKLCDELGLQPTVFLPLAEGVLRERRGRLRPEGVTKPLSRPGADRLHTATSQPREPTQLGISGALPAQHKMIKVVTEEDGVETHRPTGLSTVNWKDATGKSRWAQYVSLEGVHRHQ